MGYGFLAGVLMPAGCVLAVNQGVQFFWSQQQATIAAHEIAAGNHYVYHPIGSAALAGIGLAMFVYGLILACFLFTSFKQES